MEPKSGQDVRHATMNHVRGTLKVHWSPTRHTSAIMAVLVTKSGFAFRTAFKTVHATRERGRIKIF